MYSFGAVLNDTIQCKEINGAADKNGLKTLPVSKA